MASVMQKTEGSHPIRIAGLVPESVVDGPGLRMVVFFQGCPHRCPGCHNPETHDIHGGRLISLEEVVHQVSYNPLLQGLTISGGEPFLQPQAVQSLAQQIQQQGKDVVVYTGYHYERLLHKFGPEIMNSIYLLIDGPYLEGERDLSLAYRGSRNQRIIDLVKTRTRGTLALYTPLV